MSIRASKTILSSHPTTAFQHLDMLRREGRFIDVHLVAGGKRFPAHKAVLCACSAYFDRMFRAGFQEEDHKEVTLTDFQPDILEMLIEFMYSAKITITEENAQDLLAGSNLLLLHDVRDASSEVLSRMLDHSNCLAVRSIAAAYSCRDLERRADMCLLERFEMVCRGEEFLESKYEDVKEILAKDDIIVKSEETVWETMTAWIDHKADRSKHFISLFETLRLPLLSRKFIDDHIKPHPMVKDNEVCQQRIRQAYDIFDRLQQGSSSDDKPAFNIPMYRGSNKLLFLQCANSSPWLKTQPVLFDFKRNSWSSLPGPTSPCYYREGTCFVYHDGKVLSIGGEYNLENSDPFDAMAAAVWGLNDPGLGPGGAGPVVGQHHELQMDSAVYSLKIEDRVWNPHSKMNAERKRHQAVICDGKLFAIGGYNVQSIPLSTVEYLPLDGSKDWCPGPPMLRRRVSHGAVALNGAVWVVGGWDGQSVVRTVERLDLSANKWVEVPTKLADPVQAGEPVRLKMGVAVLDNKIYVAGGCVQTLEPCYSAHCLDPATGEWTKLPDMTYSRASPVLVPYRGRLYAFGGEGNSQGLVEMYDPHMRWWEVLDTKIKHFVNAAYSGTLVDKPWDWDLPFRADDRDAREAGSSRHMQRILSGIGLDVVQTIRSHWSHNS